MPYKSKSEREAERIRQEWMTLNEAIEHVQKAKGVNSKDARQRIFIAIDDKDLRYTCADKRGGFFSDCPESWPHAKFRLRNGGEVLCDEGITEAGREQGFAVYRPILVRRPTVLDFWEAPSPNVVSITAKPQVGRPSFYHEFVAVLEARPDLKEMALSDKIKNFKAFSYDVRKHAGKTAEDEGWADTTLRGHLEKYKNSDS
jgi:hypothetical protein